LCVFFEPANKRPQGYKDKGEKSLGQEAL